MRKYIFKRALLVLPMLFAVSFIIFFMLRLNGTDAAMSFLNASGIAPTDEALAVAKTQLGLDKPLLEQYYLWLKNVAKFNLGVSYITGRQITPDIIYYFSNSLKLIALALCFTLGLSLPLGVLSAVFKDKFIDYLIRFFSFLGVCTPNFWLGFLLISLFSVKLGWLPPFGSGGISHLLMPAFAISFMSIAISARLIRANMLENMHARHVGYAKMRGIKGARLVLSHILRNALLPVVTAIGMHFGELVGAAIVVENVFAYPGTGSFIVSAIINNDYPVILAFMLLMAVIFILSNLIIDLCYVWIDPRIRLGYK
ncbi:ABC transporter permease subunit [Helicobacter baculiformis]|uniref:ABC transporter permease subunit n=1 Tax=Helicobacter baculiformis TaxID=427351 RepID=A0ABV7ZGC9_9HELI|nr:ABC transporter permease subunit [Helicobacter baculiformis]